MRTLAGLAGAFLLVSPLFAVERHRATLPPRPSPCANLVIANSVTVSGFALADDTIYFADSSGGLLKVPKGGGTPMPIVSNPGVDIGFIAVDNSSVYFITQDSDTTGSIYSVPRSGGTPKLLATNLPGPVDMRLDATSICWLNLETIMGRDVAADGSVERMLKDAPDRRCDRCLLQRIRLRHRQYGDGTAPDLEVGRNGRQTRRRLGDLLTTEDLDSGAIAVDDCVLYYAANSSLLRTPR